MKKIKIFVEGHWFDHPFQSTCSYIKGIYRYVADNPDFELFIGGSNTNELEVAFAGKSGVNFIRYKTSSQSKYYRLGIEIPELIKKYKIELAHYQYTSPLFKNCREIVTIHDILFKDFKTHFPIGYRLTKDFLFYRSAKRADIVATVSEYSMKAVLRHYKIPKEKLIKTPNGISEEFFLERVTELPDIKRKYNVDEFILCVNRLEPRKNHIMLVKAYIELALWRRGIKLILIGREDIPVKELNNYIDSLPIEVSQNIIRLKKIEHQELLSFYRETSLFVYPSLAEGFGLPPLEAAAMRSKVLCSNATAMADFSFFENDLFNPYNQKELNEKIEKKLLEKDETRLTQIACIIARNYNWKNIADHFLRDVKRILQK